MRVPTVFALALAVLATACGGSAASASAGGRTVDVNMSEFAYAPATISLQAGETVTLRFKNAGMVEHEFMAGRQAVTGAGYKEDWLAMAKGGSGDGHGKGAVGHEGAGVRVQAKGSGTLTITVPAEKGVYEFGCFVQGHYEAGMKGTLVVR